MRLDERMIQMMTTKTINRISAEAKVLIVIGPRLAFQQLVAALFPQN
jgi:hypothetical protein